MSESPAWRADEHELRERVAHGRVTLLVGAGLSIPVKIADWVTLAKKLDPTITIDAQLRADVPLLLPMLFERVPSDELTATLRAALYETAIEPTAQWQRDNANSSLAVVSDLLVRERRRPEGSRIDRVVTFNADDMLECATRNLAQDGAPSDEQILWPIVRGSDRPFRKQPAIPVYHAHGFLPHPDRARKDAPESLVFTDLQYWSTVAEPTTFANRILAHALHDGPCIFVGLSMTDVNLARWLALRTLEVREAKERQFVGEKPARVAARFRDALVQHYWVRTEVSSAPDASRAPTLVSEWLYQRGVKTLEIPSWRDDSFKRLIEGAFATG